MHQPMSSVLKLASALTLCIPLWGCPVDGGNGLVATPAVPAAGSPQTACSNLNGTSIAAAAIGLPTSGATVTSATYVNATDAGNVSGDYCKVLGSINPVDTSAPVIKFEVNLPTYWNHKALQLGGGGFNGVLVTGTGNVPFALTGAPTPLADGYVTMGSDSGHQSTQPVPSQDGTFATNDEALTNYGYAHLKKTHDVAMALIKLRYNGLPQKMYFAGNSTGGREGMTVAERWPADYDGVIVTHPAINFTGLRMNGIRIGKAIYANGSAGWMDANHISYLVQTVMSTCDSLDGATDGIVSNVAACRAQSDAILQAVTCATDGGTSANASCLTAAQANAIRTWHTPLQLPYSLADGVNSYGSLGYNVLEGTVPDFGTSPTPTNPPTPGANAYLFVTGDAWAKYFLTRDVNFDSLTNFDPTNPGTWQQRVVSLSGVVGATNPDLSAFKARGGKLIMMQGTSDQIVNPNSNIDYYNAVVTKMGSQAAVASFMRFYVVPGFAHGGGQFAVSWDSLKALEDWVELGIAPTTQVGVDTNTGTAGRSRPMCLYPAWPKYNGTGNINSYSSYTCATT